MPLCPQITNTPITVVQNADFTVSSVLPVVAATTTQLAATNAEVAAANAAAAAAVAAASAAAAAAGAAQTAATAALAEATTAYNTAIGSLQPSANTIVNASNQITSIKSDGITIFSGADSTSGSRVVLNSLGLAAYGPGTSFAITNAVGNGTTVTYTASGHNFAVGSSVTVSDLAPDGYNGTFLVTAISGSSTFTVANTTTATLTDASGIAFGPGRSVNITNAVGNGTSVTYTASNHGYSVGTSVTISGLAPSGYNGTFLITSVVANTSFTVSNGTTATLTDASGVAQTPTLAISATTGNAVFQGSVTGSTIIGGTLNIAGKAVIDSTGLLTATGATITGDIRATSGYFGTVTNGFSISSTGLVGVGAGTIVGGSISGTTFTNGSTFSVTSAGVLTSTSGAIGGWNISSSSITKTVGTKTLTLDSSTAIITIDDTSTGTLSGGGINMSSGSVTGTYGAGGIAFSSSGSAAILYSSSELLLSGGATTGIRLQPGAGLGLEVQVDGILNSSAGSISAGSTSGTATVQIAGAFLGSSGVIIARRNNAIPIFAHKYNASGTTEMLRFIYNGNDAGGVQTTAAGVPSLRSASDYRLKSGIADFIGATEIIKNVRLRTYRYNVEPDKDAVGFVAHELSEILPSLVIGEKDAIDEEGQPVYQSVATTDLIPYLTGALKDVIVRLEALEGE
jgi:hypothetical protein